MALGTKLRLARRHYVRWGPSFPRGKRHSTTFGPCLLWPNGRPSQQLLSSCYRLVDIQYATAENRLGKKIARKKKKKPQDENIMSASATHGGHKKAASPRHTDDSMVFAR